MMISKPLSELFNWQECYWYRRKNGTLGEEEFHKKMSEAYDKYLSDINNGKIEEPEWTEDMNWEAIEEKYW
jgi:hypothetical protein